MTQEHFDTIVVGAGPGGLSAAMMLGRARRRVLVLDDDLPRNRFAHHMHAVLGFDGAPPEELRRRARLELNQYDVTFAPGHATEADASSDEVVVRTETGLHRGRTLINATGAADELAPIDGLADLWGRRVLHCPYCHGWEVRGKRLAVIATPAMGLFQAQLLRQWSTHLTAFVADAGTTDDATLMRMRALGTRVSTAPVTALAPRPDGAVDVCCADGSVTTVDAIFTGSVLAPRDTYLPQSLARLGTGFLELGSDGRTSHDRIWAVGNAAAPYANVPMSMGDGSAVGGAVNLFLVEEDLEHELRQTATPGEHGTPALSCSSG
ncbi:FAD-dependent pyridine nucleotide-disulphide oxidoreductase [Xylanimonas cellulosilytica DSM 15894]|uniref:FAD-dependent pyridine nucleotide-disulphide oxidoreductase n=1 Tax=Xylanimonas cellulosilytica (strain DSM 15894 / JCM 12276 / CECT 5975 / KCTC 9989 / LMG 20990 / NBRC 107835 / XIL07) TaxID=446471 RepID=D1BV09_XYLCX|nr:NAD(P)/FAD-dependent oxidoreductase [Xylanimonas cellulosilytica]ACZ31248.1 FAD-dependent pyridine nucleotide-disulphide oxidoreductase [Xylanimonas cellulosilytica DSM 15894]